ncbi:MAG: prolipoprotein diacylglyceryl transferase [Flavobacteriaceae bacterium]|nr:prolipoprotein diacylglyceryl transferase [Flavobacteriaceae bacterium]|tara:strand:+ start:2419 stop:3267 length:849 start_codon:yes stop_codon:yes gene_type:complete
MIFYKIDWAPNEVFFKLGPIAIHWYSLMFIVAFTLGYYIIKRIYQNENKPVELVEPLFIYVIFGTLIGARLGEVFFYNWDYFQNNLIEIFLPIKKDPNESLLFGTISGFKFVGFRGLASHGATIGIISAMFLYKYKFKFDSVLWIFDRIVIPISIGGMFVRIGNFFNSEIVGDYTGNNFGIIFANRGEIYPRHPAQLYEAMGYLILFIVLRHIYWKTDYRKKKGFIFGLFLICLFSIRVLVEFVKESQGGNLEDYLGILSTGQWLSVPFIILGIILVFKSKQ